MLIDIIKVFVAHLAYIRTSLYNSPCIVFVLGGPGSDKGALGNRLEKDDNIKHLSVGDVLRTEKDLPDSEYREIIRQNIGEGRVGPKEITVALLMKAMDDARKEADPALFLIDGTASITTPATL